MSGTSSETPKDLQAEPSVRPLPLFAREITLVVPRLHRLARSAPAKKVAAQSPHRSWLGRHRGTRSKDDQDQVKVMALEADDYRLAADEERDVQRIEDCRNS